MRVKGTSARRGADSRKARRKAAYDRLLTQLSEKRFSETNKKGEPKDPKKEAARIEKQIDHLKNIGI